MPTGPLVALEIGLRRTVFGGTGRVVHPSGLPRRLASSSLLTKRRRRGIPGVGVPGVSRCARGCQTKPVELLCYDCLLDGNAVAASSLRGSTATCDQHAMTGVLPPPGAMCQRCEIGGLSQHPAWTIRHGEAMCIFHSVDGAFADDMREHDLFASMYEQLRQRGHTDAY
jgi:hypothetical protein